MSCFIAVVRLYHANDDNRAVSVILDNCFVLLAANVVSQAEAAVCADMTYSWIWPAFRFGLVLHTYL